MDIIYNEMDTKYLTKKILLIINLLKI